MPAARACVPVSVRGLNTPVGLRILLAAFIAFAPLSECWAVGPEATGRWSKARDLGNQAIHLALLRGDPDGDPHSYIMFWEILNVAADPDTLRGGLLAWNEPEGSPCDPSTDTHNVTFKSFVNQPPMDPFCAGHSALADGRLLVTGGHLTDPVGPKKTSIFDAASKTWSAAINMAGGRWYGSNVMLSDTRTAVFGGSSHLSFLSYGGRHDGTTARDPRLQRLYVDDLQAWQPLLKIAPDPFVAQGQPTTRTGHTLIANGTNPPILFGGRDSTGAPYREMWFLSSEYNDFGESFKWDLLSPVDRHRVPRLSGHSAIRDTAGRMWVFGGLDSVPSDTNLVCRWNPTTVPPIPPNPDGQWFPLDPSGPQPSARQHHTAIYDNVSSRNRMLVFGGLDAASNAISDNSIWALDLTTQTWSQPTVTGGPPPARGGHTMLTYEFALNGKHRTVLFGGKGASSYLNDIWELWIDDATGALSWQQVTRSGARSTPRFTMSAGSGSSSRAARRRPTRRAMRPGGSPASTRRRWGTGAPWRPTPATAGSGSRR
jgi:galactose oxidase-like protein